MLYTTQNRTCTSTHPHVDGLDVADLGQTALDTCGTTETFMLIKRHQTADVGEGGVSLTGGGGTSPNQCTRRLRSDGQQRGHPQRGPARHRVDVHPERYPGNDHDQHGGQITLHQVETDAPAQVELRHQAAVISYGQG